MVKPVHFQDNLSKIPLLEKLQNASRMAPEVTKDQLAEDVKRKNAERVNTTQESKESEKSKINEKKQDKNKRKRKKRLKHLSEDEIAEELKDDSNPEDSGRLVDIFV